MSGEWVRQSLYHHMSPEIRTKMEELDMLDDHPRLTDPEIYDLDGINFHDYPVLPPREHQCWAQTKGWIQVLTYVQRCPCGAITDHDTTHWMWRNSTRDYYEKKAAEYAEAEGLQPPALPVTVLARSWRRRVFGHR